MNTVKTSTPENTTMQMLCRLPQSRPDLGAWRRFLMAVWLGLSALVSMAAPSVASPVAVLQKSVVDWVAKEQSVPTDTVVIAPLDPRMQVRACDKPLAMDLPFASLEKLRVRCVQPAWQIYVRVSLPPRMAAKSATVGPSAMQVAEVKPLPPPEKRKILVANTPLYRGQVLNESHVRLAEVDSQGLTGQMLENMNQVMHVEVVRDLKADAPLRSQDLRPVVLVKRGQMVLMSVGKTQAFQISARVEAMQDGRFGDQIKLKNRESGRILTGQVKGPNVVEGL